MTQSMAADATRTRLDPGEADRYPATHPAPAPTEVWKFGGTSVGDENRIQAVADRLVAAYRDGHRVVAVLSAMGGATDELVARARVVASDPSGREMDALLSVGEAVSCALTAMAVEERGVRAVSLNAAQVGVLTDERHGDARLRRVRPERIRAELDRGAIVLVTGFQGLSDSGDLTTLGRGGSDASAVAIAGALGLDRCTIFTDVEGVFTADPRVVPNARRLTEIRPEEMAELSEGGAGVLQARSVELAMTHGVDIRLRSSFGVGEGTWIRHGATAGEAGEVAVAGVAHRFHDPVLAISGMSPAAVAERLRERGIGVSAMVVGGAQLLLVAPGRSESEIAAALRLPLGPGGVTVHAHTGSVSVVSTGMARKPEIPARALAVLTELDVSVHLVTTAAGRVVLHVPTDRVADVARALHDDLVEHSPDGLLVSELVEGAGRRVVAAGAIGVPRVPSIGAEAV